MRALEAGSDEHKATFCRVFVETFHPYEVREVQWPELDADELARLRALPFWHEAVGSERTAAARVAAMAEVEPDPALREAIAMQAYEEARHADLVESLMRHYGISVPEATPQRPRDAEWGFLRMGYGECFDSFFAFGLFRIAADSGIFPRPLVQRFDGVMQEEARHILFFANWVAYRGFQLPYHLRPRFLVRRGLGASVQALARARTAMEMRNGTVNEDNFTMQVPAELGEVTLTKLAQICLDENERRLALYDERLLRPRFVPRLVRWAVRSDRNGNGTGPVAVG